MIRVDPLPCILSFLAGAIIPIPGYLILLSSLVCILAASAPWWVDAIEHRRDVRILRDRGINLED